MLGKAECYFHENFNVGHPANFEDKLIVNLQPFIFGSLDFARHCDWDCVNSEPISPRRQNSWEPP